MINPELLFKSLFENYGTQNIIIESRNKIVKSNYIDIFLGSLDSKTLTACWHVNLLKKSKK